MNHGEEIDSPTNADGFDTSNLDPGRLWTDQYVAEMQRFLGKSVCRDLGIYRLPSDFVLSVVVPVFNESKTIASVVDRLRETGMPLQIILVDDGSSDGTIDVMQELGSARDVIVCQHKVNRGKGAAIRTGIESATGAVTVIQDADQEYDPSDFRYLLQPILAEEADVAYGTRYGHCDRQLSPWWHQAVNGFLSTLASLAIGIRLSDVETCYKMARTEHWKSVQADLKENRFGIEIEITARWVRRGLTLTDRPIRYQHRWYDE